MSTVNEAEVKAADDFKQLVEELKAGLDAHDIRPMREQIIVVRRPAKTQSAGGILLPDQAVENAHQAVVLAVGRGRLMDDGTCRPLDIKVDDAVYLSSYAGNEIVFGEHRLTVIRESDVLAYARQ